LGEGGFGEVWLGRHEKLKERRVFKFCFHADRVRSLKREVTLFRLLKERGNHPNIVGIQDVFFDEPPFYIMMDYADGEDLSRWAQKQGGLDKVPLEARLEIIAQVADALQAAHEAGIIHRDVKPSNIIVCGSFPGSLQVKLTDFGIGKVVSKDVLSGVTQMGFTQTLSGSSDTGTPMYMAPELHAGKPASTRSDIYSLGVVLYQLLAGDLTRPPTMDWARDIESPLLKEDLSKCLAGNPQERFAAAQELAQRLRTLPERRLQLSRREAEIAEKVRVAHRKGVMKATAVAMGVILLVAGLAIWAVFQSSVAKSEARRAEVNEKTAVSEAKNTQVAMKALAVEANLAQAAATEVRMNMAASDFSLAVRLIAQDHQNDALAYLNESLSLNPTNEAALTRLTTLLASHSWWVPIREFKHGDSVLSAQFSPDGKRIVTASGDRTARVWDAQSGLPLTEPLPLKYGPGPSLQFSPDGKRIVTAGFDTARVWDAENGQPLTEPLKLGPYHMVFFNEISVQFSPDGSRIVLVALDGTVRVWDAKSGQPLTGSLQSGVVVRNAHFSPDGKRIVTASGDAALVLDAQSGQPLTRPLQHGDVVWSAQFSPDGKRIITASGDGSARVWDAQTGQPLTEPLQVGGTVGSAQFTPDGTQVLTVSIASIARAWDAQSGRPLTGALQHDDAVLSARFSPDGKRIVTASDDGTAQVWETQSGQPVPTHLKHGNLVKSARFSPDGRRIVTASLDGTARVWDAQSGQPLTEPMKHDGYLNSAQFSPDGKRVVTASGYGTARVWDAESGQPLTKSLEHAGAVNSAQFSPDGKRIVTASDSGTARVWDARSGQLLSETYNIGAIHSAQFSPDGKRIVTTSQGAAWVWDAQSGQQLTEPMKHSGWVNSAQFSPDGKRIVTASYDHTARVWDAQNGQPLSDPLQHSQGANSAQFSPDGKRIVTGSSDGAQVWDLAPSSENHPAWLTQLAEAISGQTLNKQGLLEPTQLKRGVVLDQLQHKLNQEPDDDEWVHWGRWFLADPATRTISPFSKMTVPEYIEDRIKENTAESLDEAEQLASGNADLLKRIAQARQALGPTTSH